MASEVILSECLGKDIGNLISCANGEDLDQSFANVFAKVVVAHVDVLSARAKLWKSCEFEST